MKYLVRWMTHVRRYLQAGKARAELQSLDTRTLRDLGIDRSEIASLVEEWAGRAERVRKNRFVPYY